MVIENLDATIKGSFSKRKIKYIRSLVYKIRKKEFIKVQ